MKNIIIYFFIVAAIILTSCKGDKKANAADSGQTHVGNAGPSDSSSYRVSPTETGGKDSSGNGSGNTNAAKDTIKTNPK